MNVESTATNLSRRLTCLVSQKQDDMFVFDSLCLCLVGVCVNDFHSSSILIDVNLIISHRPP
jgi:hypothetical protein